MGRSTEYRARLRELPASQWDAFLLAESGLPGPRGNIELAEAVADEGSAELFERYLAYSSDVAPTNTPEEFLAFCGVLGTGRLVADGDTARLGILRTRASDERWRTREAVAMALQRLGDVDMARLLDVATEWADGSMLEQRAAAAALCEPRLLRDPKAARSTLDVLDTITESMTHHVDRRAEEFKALRKGMAYCWSVAVAALPDEGKLRMERWFATKDSDVRWVMRENLKKGRLSRMDVEWVDRWQACIA